jgi:2-polyprenyl-3-methyl-5-hydroxy-6-metoxy-1,4-benzoquinol methylase
MKKSSIEARLEELNRRYPEKWYHNYYFGDGIQTIPGQPGEDNFLMRSDIVMELVYLFLGISSPEEIATRSMRLLDLASAEGLQSIEAAMHGFDTIGVEGRRPFIERAELAKEAFNLENVRFIEGDVRKLSKADLGMFDVTLCLGILYHLNRESLVPFLISVAAMTKRLLIVDTHISNAESAERYRLGAEDSIDGRYFGRTYHEHPKGLTLLQKLSRLRASLENDESFWLDYNSLCNLLHDQGFDFVLDVKRPEYNTSKELLRTRVLLVALKARGNHIPRCYLSNKSQG